MPYPDKYQMSRKEAQFFARKNLVDLVYSLAKLKGNRATRSQTQTVIDGVAVSGISIDELTTIVNLKRSWHFVIANEAPYSLKTTNLINGIIVKDDWPINHTRTSDTIFSNTTNVSQISNERQFQKIIQNILNQDKSWTARLLELLLQMMRAQFYWDGNKRTAFLTVNYLAINAGIGLINVNENQLEIFNQLLSDFYESNQPKTLMDWLYANCIHGLDFEH